MRHIIFILSFLCSLFTYSIDYVYDASVGLVVSWEADDAVGVFSQGGKQIRFDVTSVNSADSHTAVSYGWGVSLKKSMKYLSLSPYSEYYYEHDNISTALPISYHTLLQKANNSAEHIAPYDLMAAEVVTTTENTATFKFSHLSAVLRLNMKVPETATFVSASISTADAMFVKEGVLNLDANHSITAKEKSKSVSLTLDNIIVNRGSMLNSYFILPATNLSGKEITAEFVASNGVVYSCTFTGQDYAAGKLYNVGRTLSAKKMSDSALASISDESLASARRKAVAKVSGVVQRPTLTATDFQIAKSDEVYAALPNIRGDVNGDGRVDDKDIEATASYIMGNRPANFDLNAADAYLDGNINIGDLTEMSNIKTQ